MPPGVELAADNQERMTLEAENLTKHTIQNTKKYCNQDSSRC